VKPGVSRLNSFKNLIHILFTFKENRLNKTLILFLPANLLFAEWSAHPYLYYLQETLEKHRRKLHV
jgi:hypothetical protein